MRRIRVLVNPRSGASRSFSSIRKAIDGAWDRAGVDLCYQFVQSPADGIEKSRRAIDCGCETIIVCGGDGTVSTVGRALIGSNAALAVIPTGSGNGLARHFEIPLTPDGAAAALASGEIRAIDVGVVNGMPFLVTCSMAWDAAIVRSFERSPVRGIVPYIFAGVQELIGYRPQDVKVTLDDLDTFSVLDPILLTVANLTQYGGGARIAPSAQPDDGMLELVVARRHDMAALLSNAAHFFDGTLDRIPEVTTRRFRKMLLTRRNPSPIQIDGELVDAGREIEVAVLPKALRILAPARRT